MRKFIVLLWSVVLITCLSSCETGKMLEPQIGTAAVEFEGIIYLADEQTSTVRCYDLSDGTQEILLKDVSVESLALDWPELWMVEGSRQLLKLNLSSGKLDTVYTSNGELNGLFFIYGDSVYFEESADDLNVDCKRLNRKTGNCILFLEKSNIYLTFHIAFYKNQLFYTSTGGPVYCITMDGNSKPQMVDADSWFTVVGTDSALYYSKYVDGTMRTIQYNTETNILSNDEYDFLQVCGRVGDIVFAEANQGGKRTLIQIDSQSTNIVFENCAQFVYSDTPSIFYYLDSGILFWNNKNILDSRDSSNSKYYIFLYDLNTKRYRLLDEIL